MCTFGRVCVRSPLPSFVTITLLPVSATRKFAPVMPTSAARNVSRRLGARLGQDIAAFVEHAVGGQIGVGDLRNAASQSSRFRWKAGAMMWLGVSWRNWRMYSPEVGLHRNDAVLFQVLVDAQLLADHRLALGHRARAGRLADRQHGGAGFGGIGAPVHGAAGFGDAGGVFLQVEIQMRQRVVLDRSRLLAQDARTPAGRRRRRRGGR